ncbi:hypothetical protein CBI38_08855 [Rhodococcus oxybenzonivorans]|uniref:Uncharacterized protein n=1 Tax=Rhodococcus oxybenzonivorans TaxID=1990687 RepID=A0A2S2BSY3_9NOCA|nr:hypothetical protein CBI38_08855 [Rhodococcus oxybenzonivorans]
MSAKKDQSERSTRSWFPVWVRTQFVARAHVLLGPTPAHSGGPEALGRGRRLCKGIVFGANDPPSGIIPRQPVLGEARRLPQVMRFHERGRVVQRGQFVGCGGGGPCAAGGDGSAAIGQPGVVTFGAQQSGAIVRPDCLDVVVHWRNLPTGVSVPPCSEA